MPADLYKYVFLFDTIQVRIITKIFTQVFRFLRVPITSRMLSDILSRLVETIAEQGEDMQVIAIPTRNANRVDVR